MMAVIFFCLRPHANNRAASIRQLGCYIWVPPPENPQGLGQLYVFAPFIGKGKVDESAKSAGAAVENSSDTQRGPYGLSMLGQMGLAALGSATRKRPTARPGSPRGRYQIEPSHRRPFPSLYS